MAICCAICGQLSLHFYAQRYRCWCCVHLAGLDSIGRVDGGNAHFHLLVGARVAAAHGQGVAVADGDDQAEQGGGEGHGDKQKEVGRPGRHGPPALGAGGLWIREI